MGGKLEPIEPAKEVSPELEKVAALRSECTGCDISENGIYINFADGRQREFSDVEHVKRFVSGVLTEDVLDAMHCARLLNASPDLAKLDAITAKTMTIDLTAAEVVKVQ